MGGGEAKEEDIFADIQQNPKSSEHSDLRVEVSIITPAGKDAEYVNMLHSTLLDVAETMSKEISEDPACVAQRDPVDSTSISIIVRVADVKWSSLGEPPN